MGAPFGAPVVSQGFRIGQIVQSPVNLEALYPGEWMACDGRDVLRSAVSSTFAAQFPAGVFTSTARTLDMGAPSSAVIAADATNFICPAVAGTTPIQASPTGASGTWVGSATWTAATSPASIILAGSRFVMAGSGGDLAAPYVSAANQTAANQVAKANWTATTGGTTTTLTQGLAYGSTANAGSGRTVLVPNGAGTSIYTLDDGATAWATQTASSQTKTGVCWTGQKFLVTTAPTAAGTWLIQTSPTGVTWTDSYIPHPAFGVTGGAGTTAGIASDGNGTVVIPIYFNSAYPIFESQYVMVSKDHGATWRSVTLPAEVYGFATSTPVQYVNGKFLLPCFSGIGILVSADGLSWQYEPIGQRGIAATAAFAYAYKAGTYCGVRSGGVTAAMTCTEDVTKFRLPNGVPAPAWMGNSQAGSAQQFDPKYIKVA